MTAKGNKAQVHPLEIKPIPDAVRLAELQRVRVVLVRTSLARNIGSAARAMRNMGLKRLYLVAPAEFPHADATTLASGADDVLEQAVICESLAQALSGTILALGTSARRRGIVLAEQAPFDACQQAIATLRATNAVAGDVALVFGSERVGLENDELKLCQIRVQIPTDPEFNSLNLAQAVQLLSYDMRRAALAAGGIAELETTDVHVPASSDEFERMLVHLTETLAQLNFHGTKNPDLVLTRLRRLFQRAKPDHRELNILRGICSDVQQALEQAKTSQNQ